VTYRRQVCVLDIRVRYALRLPARLTRPTALAGVAVLAALLLAACAHPPGEEIATRPAGAATSPPVVVQTLPKPPPAPPPPVGPDPTNLYAQAGAGQLAPVVRSARPLVYVPDSDAAAVDLIDPATRQPVGRLNVAETPQHVVPSWDLSTLYVVSESGQVARIDPRTGKLLGAGTDLPSPYDLYFSPDGRFAIDVAEATQDLLFLDPQTLTPVSRLHVDCPGINHLDFSADESYLIASCEYASRIVRVDLRLLAVTGYLDLGGMPQEVRLDPRGRYFYVGDIVAGGLHLVDGAAMKKVGFIKTGQGAYGIVVSRDGRLLFVTNRGDSSVSVVDVATGTVKATWRIAGATPDLASLSGDGSVLWVSGRFDATVYALSTTDGTVLARIPVGKGPHGLLVWPQPGGYSLGSNGIMR
jgi:YVTN family beta-propeller protein